MSDHSPYSCQHRLLLRTFHLRLNIPGASTRVPRHVHIKDHLAIWYEARPGDELVAEEERREDEDREVRREEGAGTPRVSEEVCPAGEAAVSSAIASTPIPRVRNSQQDKGDPSQSPLGRERLVIHLASVGQSGSVNALLPYAPLKPQVRKAHLL